MKHPFYIKACGILLFIALLITILILGQSLFVPLFISIFIAILLMPACSWVERKIKLPRTSSAAIMVMSSLFLILTILTLFVNEITSFRNDIDMMEGRLNELLIEGKAFVESITGNEPLQEINSINEAVSQVVQENTSTLTQSAFSVLGGLIWLILIPIFVFLFLIYRTHFKQFLVKVLSAKHPEDQSQLDLVITRIKQLVQSYISGMFIVIIILAVANSIVLFSFGIEHAIFFALFAAFLNIIPYIGPQVGAITAVAYGLVTKDSVITPLAIYGCFMIIQLIESNVLTPRIVGHSVSINPLITILAIFVGNMIWGVAGMILIIPIVAIMKEIFDQIPALQPYAFLIGNVSTGDDREAKFISKQFELVNKRIPIRKVLPKK